MKKIFTGMLASFGLLSGHAQPSVSLMVQDDTVTSLLQNMHSIDTMPAVTAHFVDANPYALVAGGSKGIGYAIAQALAKRKYNLILIARHIDTLVSAKNKLEAAYGIHVEILQHDLSTKEAATDIAKWCTERNIN